MAQLLLIGLAAGAASRAAVRVASSPARRCRFAARRFRAAADPDRGDRLDAIIAGLIAALFAAAAPSRRWRIRRLRVTSSLRHSCIGIGLARPGGSAIWRCSRGRARHRRELEWYPVGRLVVWTAMLAPRDRARDDPDFGTDADALRAGLRRAFERTCACSRRTPPMRRCSFPGCPTPTRRSICWCMIVPPMTATVRSPLTTCSISGSPGASCKSPAGCARPWPRSRRDALPAVRAGRARGRDRRQLPARPDRARCGRVRRDACCSPIALLGFAIVHMITARHERPRLHAERRLR